MVSAIHGVGFKPQRFAGRVSGAVEVKKQLLGQGLVAILLKTLA
jgi:hypothetical protein